MRPILPLALVALSVATAGFCETDNAVAIRIDNDIAISTSELNTYVEAMLRAQGVPPDQMETVKAQAWSHAIDQLVLQKLLVRAAANEGVKVSDEDVQEFLKARLPPGTTLADVAKRENMTEEKLTDEIKTNLCINKHIEGKVAEVSAPTDEDLQKLFEELSQRNPEFAETQEQVEARHILIKTEKGASAEDRAKARAKLEGIRKDIVDGKAEFAAMAEQHSDCPSGKRGGGNLGYFGRGQMVKPFEDAAFGQKPGVVGDVIETDFGFHIVEVLNQKPASKRTVESEREQLTEMALRKKKGEKANEYFEALKKAAKVEVLVQPPAPPPPPPAADAEPAPARELPVWAQ